MMGAAARRGGRAPRARRARELREIDTSMVIFMRGRGALSSDQPPHKSDHTRVDLAKLPSAAVQMIMYHFGSEHLLSLPNTSPS